MTRITVRISLVVLVAVALLAVPLGIYAKDEQSWVGKIETRPTSGSVGTWVVRGHTFAVTAATRIDEEAGSLSVGACAEVHYTSAGGTDTATRIERQADTVCGGSSDGGEQTVYALIEAIPAGNVGVWQIGGQAYTSTASTRLRQEHGSFAVGSCAEVEFTSASGTNTARSISTEDAFRCSNGTFLNRARGAIQSFPSTLIGTWQISGVSYETTTSTTFQQRSPFAVGSCVEVAYVVQNGVTIAKQIESEGADDCAGTGTGTPTGGLDDRNKLYAPIETLPASPFIGAWRIGGVDASATATTRFEQNNGAFAIGVCVEASYVIEGGTNRLTSVESKPTSRCQTGSAGTLRAYGAIDTFPVSLTGTWNVGGISYQTNASTSFEQRFGRFDVGAFVEVTYRVEGNTRIATAIETHVAPGAGLVTRTGPLESRPSDDTGIWVIGGVSYHGDRAIEVELERESEHEGEHRAIQNVPAATSTQVVVNSYQASDGALYATSVTAVRQIFLPIVQK